MVTHYVDIRLLPDPEFSQAYLLGALYARLRRAVVGLDTGGICVSFPQYRVQPRILGHVMRVHGGEAALAALLSTDGLRGMRDHVDVTAVSLVPSGVQQRGLVRRQFKT